MHKLVLVESCNTDECPGKLNQNFEIQDKNDITYKCDYILYILILAQYSLILFQVNCEWGRWQNQKCDCATGLMTRTRQKTKEMAFGGRECDGKPSGTIACNYLECKSKYHLFKNND